MNRLNYSESIFESSAALLQLERSQSDGQSRDRVKFIRLLKSGICKTQAAAGSCIGIKRTQSQYLWRTYINEGITGLLKRPSKRGFGKLNSRQISQLRSRLSLHDIVTQQDLMNWILLEFGVTYTQAGISLLLKRLKIKLKTGRPSNVRKDEAELAQFKKSFHNGEPLMEK